MKQKKKYAKNYLKNGKKGLRRFIDSKKKTLLPFSKRRNKITLMRV